LEKCVGHNLKLLDVVQKFGPLSENFSPLLVSQAGYGPGYDTYKIYFVNTTRFLLFGNGNLTRPIDFFVTGIRSITPKKSVKRNNIRCVAAIYRRYFHILSVPLAP